MFNLKRFSPLTLLAIGIGLGVVVNKFVLPKIAPSVSGLGQHRHYAGVPGDRYIGIQRSKAIMTALQGVHSRLGFSELPAVDIDPRWSRIPAGLPGGNAAMRTHARAQ